MVYSKCLTVERQQPQALVSNAMFAGDHWLGAAFDPGRLNDEITRPVDAYGS